eukprot:904138-Alexandrium_andersonii.AAC.1
MPTTEPNAAKGVSPRRCPSVQTSFLHAHQRRAADGHRLRLADDFPVLGAGGLRARRGGRVRPPAPRFSCP